MIEITFKKKATEIIFQIQFEVVEQCNIKKRKKRSRNATEFVWHGRTCVPRFSNSLANGNIPNMISAPQLSTKMTAYNSRKDLVSACPQVKRHTYKFLNRTDKSITN